MTPLLPRQAKLLEIIRQHIADHGAAPTFEEMAAAMGLASKSHVHVILTGLEERGAIRRIPNRARALEIVEPAPALLVRVDHGGYTIVQKAPGLTRDQFREALQAARRAFDALVAEGGQ